MEAAETQATEEEAAETLAMEVAVSEAQIINGNTHLVFFSHTPNICSLISYVYLSISSS